MNPKFEILFYKYQGTGNDFVLIDNRKQQIHSDKINLIKSLCNRKLGIGADGLILLENSPKKNIDFEMLYFNSDGKKGTMCGNGGRCVSHFADFLNIFKKKATFSANGDIYQAQIEKEEVKLKMKNVSRIKKIQGLDKQFSAFFMDTGSPHHIDFVKNIKNFPVYHKGKTIREAPKYVNLGGTNVNFVECLPQKIIMRTFERGVEDETLSCGTGATAVALACAEKGYTSPIQLQTSGGILKVDFKKVDNHYVEIYLTGEVKQVFKGKIEI